MPLTVPAVITQHLGVQPSTFQLHPPQSQIHNTGGHGESYSNGLSMHAVPNLLYDTSWLTLLHTMEPQDAAGKQASAFARYRWEGRCSRSSIELIRYLIAMLYSTSPTVLTNTVNVHLPPRVMQFSSSVLQTTQLMLNQIRSDQIRSNQIKSNQYRLIYSSIPITTHFVPP